MYSAARKPGGTCLEVANGVRGCHTPGRVLMTNCLSITLAETPAEDVAWGWFFSVQNNEISVVTYQAYNVWFEVSQHRHLMLKMFEVSQCRHLKLKKLFIDPT